MALAVAGLLALALAAPPAPHRSASAEARVDAADEVALLFDDQCATGDEQCALNALQIRTESSRPRKSKVQDITAKTERELLAKVALIQKNTSAMQRKLHYLKMDYRSTLGLIHNTPNRSIGVNGTEVDWADHEATWYPQFSLLEAEDDPTEAEAEALEDLIDGGEADDMMRLKPLNSSLNSSSGHPSSSRRRRTATKIAGMPPRARKVQWKLTAQQSILDKVWNSMTVFERNIHRLINYMHGHTFVALSQYEDVEEASMGTRHPHPVQQEVVYDYAVQTEKDLLVQQIRSADRQTEDIWRHMGSLGTQVQGLKSIAAAYTQRRALAQVGAAAEG